MKNVMTWVWLYRGQARLNSAINDVKQDSRVEKGGNSNFNEKKIMIGVCLFMIHTICSNIRHWHWFNKVTDEWSLRALDQKKRVYINLACLISISQYIYLDEHGRLNTSLGKSHCKSQWTSIGFSFFFLCFCLRTHICIIYEYNLELAMGAMFSPKSDFRFSLNWFSNGFFFSKYNFWIYIISCKGYGVICTITARKNMQTSAKRENRLWSQLAKRWKGGHSDSPF